MKYIGTQTFGLGKELTADLKGTLLKLRQIGFNAVEPCLMFDEKQGDVGKNHWSMETLREAKAYMAEIGMTITSVHCNADPNGALTAEEVAEKLLRVNEEFGISVFVTSNLVSTVEQGVKAGEYYKKVNDILKDKGCRLLFHNHNVEMEMLTDCEGKRGIDVIMETAGEDLQLQLDIGWAGYVGDEIKIAQEFKDKIYLIHLKDFYQEYVKKGIKINELPVGAFAPMGEGSILLSETLGLADQFPQFQQTIIIDQDGYAGNMLDSLKIGFDNIRSWGIEIEE